VTIWSHRTELRGFRIAGVAAAAHVGVRIHAGLTDLDDLILEGPLDIGVDVVGAGSQAVVRGSRFTGITGLPVQAAEQTRLTLRQNVFRAPAGAAGPAVRAPDAAALTNEANLFVHYGRLPIVLATGPAIIIDPTYLVLPPAAPPRSRAR
jgi:hypothetical protein